MMVPIRTSGQLGPLLRRLRLDRGLTQAQLGNAIGLSQERVSAIENSPESVSFDQLLTIMMALGSEFAVSLDAPEVRHVASRKGLSW
jgi:HTH-type transcriptional regulator / antitoxin HipB